MSTVKKLVSTAAAILLVAGIVCAQEQPPASSRSRITVTATVTADRVRFTAPSTVVQMRLEVYAGNGEKLFDNEIRGGNVIDWHLQDGKTERLSDGSYLCVITTKSISGRMSQKFGKITIETAAASVDPTDTTQLTAQQTQAVGPLEENASLTVLKEGETQTTTVIAHNGEEGQITRGRGALSFRIGDFYSGKDTEQMRLTPEGNLGIGITHPLVRLDVDGMIRATQGIVFPDGTTQYSAASKTLGAKSTGPDQMLGGKHKFQTEATGAGTLGQLAKWTDNSGTLGDTAVSESNGSVVVGTMAQTGNIQIFGPATGDVFAGMGPDPINGPAFNYGYAGGSFGRSAGFFNVRPDASAAAPNPSLRFATANVQRMIIDNVGNVGIGTITPQSKLVVHAGGSGGEINFGTPSGESGMAIVGTNRADVRFDGATLKLLAGTGPGAMASTNGITVGTNGKVGIGTIDAVARLRISGAPPWTDVGWGAALELDNGSAIGWRSDGFHVPAGIGVSSGYTYFFTAAASPGETGGDHTYNLVISNIGQVGIGTPGPDEKLHVVGNIHISGCLRNDSVTLAGNCSSDLRFKKQVTPFPKLLNKVAQLQPAHFFWRASEFPQKHFGTTQSYGLIAQDVEATLPELVTEDEQGYKQVDYSKLPLLTLQAVKELKAENDALKQQNAVLENRLTGLEQALQRLLGQQQGQAQPSKRQQ